MTENYVVNYKINIDSEKAASALTTFVNSTSGCTQASEQIATLEKSVGTLIKTLKTINTKGYGIKVKIGTSNQNIQSIITKLQSLDAAVTKERTVKINLQYTQPKLSKTQIENLAAQAESVKHLKEYMPAQEHLGKMSEAYSGIGKQFGEINAAISKINQAYGNLQNKNIEVNINNSKALLSLTEVENKLLQIDTLAKQNRNISITETAPGVKSKRPFYKRIFGGKGSVGESLPSHGSMIQIANDANRINTSFFNVASNLSNLVKQFNKLDRDRSFKVSVNTEQAQQELDSVIAKLQTIRNLAREKSTLAFDTGSVDSSSPGSVFVNNQTESNQEKEEKNKKPKKPKKYEESEEDRLRRRQNKLAYKVLGPSMLDSSGFSVFDMAKGMGLAYGMSGLGQLFGNIVHDSADYNNIMQTTRNILASHDNDRNFEGRYYRMEDTIRQVGVDTKFTAPEVADASKFLAMAGFNVGDITKSISSIADIALVGDTELGETADVVTNIMTGYGIAPEKMRHAADIMTQTFTMSNTTLMEIAESYKYAASLLKAGGVSFEEATAAIGILGNAGIKGSQAGTTMRTIMGNIVNPTKKQARAWERSGVARLDENGNVRDLVDIFGDLARSGIGLTDIYQMFHKTAAQGAVALMTNVKDWNKIVEENFISEGLVSSLAEKKKNTIQGLWAQLTSAITEAGLQAFEATDSPIRDLLKTLIADVRDPEFTKALRELGQSLLSITQAAINMVKTFMRFYDVMKRPIELFLKAQMWISPMLVALRLLQGSLNMVTWAYTSATRVMQIFKANILVNGVAIKATSDGMKMLNGRLFVTSKALKTLKSITKGFAILAIAFAGLEIWDRIKNKNEELRRANKNFADFIKKTSDESKAAVAGYATSSHKSLDVVYNDQKKVNEVLAENIRLMRLQKDEQPDNDGKPIENKKDTIKNTGWGKWYEAFNYKMEQKAVYSGVGAAKPSISYYAIDPNEVAEQLKIKGIKFKSVAATSSSPAYWWTDDGFKFPNAGAAASFLFLYSLGRTRNSDVGKYREFDKLQKTLEKSKTYEEFIANKKKAQAYIDRVTRPNKASLQWLPADIAKYSTQSLVDSAGFTYGLRETLNADLGSDLHKAQEALMKVVDAGETPSDELLGNFLRANNISIFKGAPIFSPEYMKAIGYWDNQWHDMDGMKKEDLREQFMAQKQQIYDAMQSLWVTYRKPFKRLLNHKAWGYGQGDAKTRVDNYQSYTDKDNVTWRYLDDNKWHAPGKAPLTEEEMWDKVNGFGDSFGDISDLSSQAGLDSGYNANTAAPKQVIVRIENLMNVDKIDMTNPDNKAVINNFKDQLASALMGAVNEATSNL